MDTQNLEQQTGQLDPLASHLPQIGLLTDLASILASEAFSPVRKFLHDCYSNLCHCSASGLGSFDFFSKTWIFGSDSTKPLEVDSPILPPIAATHMG